MAKKQKPPRERDLSINEETNALDYLERAVQFIKETEKNYYAWKWVTISLHGALYGFAICACKGTDPNRVTQKNGNLIDINEAIKRCKKDAYMQQYIDSKTLSITPGQSESIHWLITEFRNNFVHFSPTSWAIEVHGFPQIAIDVLGVVRFLAIDSNNLIHYKQSQIKRIKSLIFQAKRFLKNSKLYKEAQLAEQIARDNPLPKVKDANLHERDLQALKDLALAENENFFKRNDHLSDSYSTALRGIALCKRVACHYISMLEKRNNPGKKKKLLGYRWFDICFFYVESEGKPFPYNTKKIAKGGYKGKDVVYWKRLIQEENIFPDDIANALKPVPTNSIFMVDSMLDDALIGIWPEALFGKVLWGDRFCNYW